MTTTTCDQCGRTIVRASSGWTSVTERRTDTPRVYDFCNTRCLTDWTMQRATPGRKLTHDDFDRAREMLAQRRDEAVARAGDMR